MTQKLVCIGDNVVDFYGDRDVFYPGGNALNVAVLARRAGLAGTVYIGIVGNDRAARHVEESILAEGLSLALLRRAEGPNGIAQVAHDAGGDRVFVASNHGGIRRKLMLRMDEADLAVIRDAAWVHSSCFSYLEPELPRIRSVARALSFDFSTAQDPDYLARVTPWITTAFLSGANRSLDDLRAQIATLHALGAGTVCVTRGSEGAIWSRGGTEILQAIVPVQVVDTMGAGDAFIAGFLAATIQGASPEDALAHAAAIAARACQWEGAWGHPMQGSPVALCP